MKSLVDTESVARGILSKRLEELLFQNGIAATEIILPFLCLNQVLYYEIRQYWDFNIIVKTPHGEFVGFGHVYKFIDKTRICLLPKDNFKGVNKYYRDFIATILDLWEKMGSKWRAMKYKLKGLLK